ncbi:MAG: PilZ domain-containing protein [Candidatus Rokubacteria bacterium]|nr:PilZ domain-containing protein [Candidatus Rokubacteria bacterium]
MSTAPTGGERRAHPRRPVQWPARIWIGADTLVGLAIDVSEQGLCIATAPTSSVKVGSSYRIELLAEQGAEIAFNGEVRHVTERRIGVHAVQIVLPRLHIARD